MKYFLPAIFCCLSFICSAQTGKIEGRVTDSKTGKPLTGVSVIEPATQRGTATDVEGRYSISVESGANKSLVFSYNGVSQEIKEIEVKAGGVTVQDLSLVQREKLEQEVIVRSASTARRETAASLIAFQKNTNTVASVISAETIRRSPDRNTGEVLKRTPGTSIQEGRFIVVRGLADRYNQAMLNGILLTSTEPDRKTFSFDIIPAQLIDNIIINKAFVPELPGEFAGGLIQINTKDIPSKNFFSVQIGSGFNTQTTGKDFYRDPQGGKYDWLGFDDGTRALPAGYTTKSNFDTSSRASKTAIGKGLRNSWAPVRGSAPVNSSVQFNGGFTSTLFGKKIGGAIGINYSRNFRYLDLVNSRNILNDNASFSNENRFDDDKYVQETTLGGLAVGSVQLNPLNRVSGRLIINLFNNSSSTRRNGFDITRNTDTTITGLENTFKQNTFFTGQLSGEHGIIKSLKLKWYGAFNILDGYSPDQRRLLYSKAPGEEFRAILSNTLSQQTGSRIYQNLSDYIYTAGGDLAYTLKLFGFNQTLKGGYMLQIKDRIYDAQLFANYLPVDNDALKLLPPDRIFAPENFGNGYDNKFAFDAIRNKNFRYIANTILNAGYLQMDNRFTDKFYAVYGLRVENYDQLIGSVKRYDTRHFNTNITDFLPGVNLTYKLNPRTNFRLTGSQTVIRPELRELSSLNLYDFELNASVQGKPTLKRTKIFNTDFRYELYPRAGEVFAAGLFYKKFNDPIEQLFNEGSGGASTFTFQNPESAISYGVEVEVRKKLDFNSHLKNFTVQANVSVIKSSVTDTTFKIDRPLQGQSNYVLNGGLLYDNEKLGLNITGLFNMIGRRIYLVGDVTAGSATPNVWEKPRALFDIQIAKKVLQKRGEFRLNASDILNQKQIFYQNSSDESSYSKKADALRFTRINGTTFSLTFNYTL